jgi:excisionase family DNA binding protein
MAQNRAIKGREKVWKPQRISEPMGPRLLAVKKAAAYLGVSRWMVDGMITRGDLPFVRFGNGRKQFIDMEDLEEIIQNNKSRVR